MPRETSSRSLGSRRDPVRDVRRVVSTLRPPGHPSIQLVAGVLGMSARTLQRRLGDVGLTYARVVAEARADMARQMLKDTAQKVGDIARTIGYSDAGHFTRAFLRWTGLTPREFRRLRRETVGGVAGSPGDQTPRAG
jgi:AraC-like DNA-binding protein